MLQNALRTYENKLRMYDYAHIHPYTVYGEIHAEKVSE